MPNLIDKLKKKLLIDHDKYFIYWIDTLSISKNKS